MHMEEAFRFAILAPFVAKKGLCAADTRHGRGALHTILGVPTVLHTILDVSAVLDTLATGTTR
ncbi:MAG: hypothetical protein J2P17_27400 [Mycobacterium sp.]|nr:hypothetical protein [Mycobacterium sp.]